MNQSIIIDVDPLNAYESSVFNNYSIPNNYQYQPQQNYPCKEGYTLQNYQNTQNQTSHCDKNTTDNQNGNNGDNNSTEDVKPVIEDKNNKKKPKGRKSSYWNKKITDKDFAFYGCSVCNISYTDIKDLDQHVQIHTNRITSYDVRIQNKKKRKRLKKEKKKKEKESKNSVKQEFDIEIKPEEGYIGNELTKQYKENESKITDSSDNHNGGNENNENKPVNNDNTDNGKSNVYKCFGCGKQFALSYYLRIHVRSHTDEKPYKCNFCEQSFITASKLGRHKKRIHLATRNQCRICYKIFNRFELLVAHFDKKHAEDKLEGEPYDYNAILPYLKELEEQLRIEKEEKERKPKIEDSWGDSRGPNEVAAQSGSQNVTVTVDKENLEDEKPVLKEETILIPVEYNVETTVGKILIEEVKVDEVKVDEVKQEVDETPEVDEVHEEMCDVDEPEIFCPDIDDDVKNERDSDSDYFPPESCAVPPETSPPAHAGATRPTCSVCNRTFSSNSYLVVHMRTHTGEKPFKCYICGRGFITSGKMHRHVLTHDESWIGENGIKPEGMELRDDPNEKDAVKSKLKMAKNKLLKKSKLMEKKTNKKRDHACEFCQKRFLHIETLQVHKKCHEGETLVYKCNYCLEPQNDAVTLEAHEKTHVGPKPYLCTICGKEYKKKVTLIYHKKNHKASEPTFVCDMCSKRFRSQTKLERHIASHSTEKYVLRYECPVCAHMFHTKYHVQMHLRSHQKEGLIQDENRSAVLAMVLQNARKIPKTSETNATVPQNLHTDERSRICNICGEIFQHFYYLEEHLKTHGSKIALDDVEKEVEKKYTCQVCSKSFKLHYYLKLHSYTHTKEKPYICQQCGKGFITKGKLKRHLETHQGLKKYQCHICYKFFTRPSYLRIHVRTIHGTQDYNFRDYSLGMAS